MGSNWQLGEELGRRVNKETGLRAPIVSRLATGDAQRSTGAGARVLDFDWLWRALKRAQTSENNKYLSITTGLLECAPARATGASPKGRA